MVISRLKKEGKSTKTGAIFLTFWRVRNTQQQSAVKYKGERRKMSQKSFCKNFVCKMFLSAFIILLLLHVCRQIKQFSTGNPRFFVLDVPGKIRFCFLSISPSLSSFIFDG